MFLLLVKGMYNVFQDISHALVPDSQYYVIINAERAMSAE